MFMPASRSLLRRHVNLLPTASLSSQSTLDPVQLQLMKEECILVNEQDEMVGSATKRACHENTGLLHRAFSVFLFNNQNQLLLQQRADEKILFPLHWANTCCSHPLAMESELPEENHLGVKRAAARKLHQELGMPLEELPTDRFHFLTRVHYYAASNAEWAEHEIDHILLLRGEYPLDLNPNEVKAIHYLNREDLAGFVADKNNLISPWFRLMADTMLPQWWDNLDQITQDVDDCKIHRF